MEKDLQKIIDKNERKRYNNFEKSLIEYIPELADFARGNYNLPRNQYSDGFGEENQSKPKMRFKRSITVGNNDGEIRPFTRAFAELCLQVARNLSPYQTGNLRDNIQVRWSPEKIDIDFNAKGTATYTFYLDNGYPNAKWRGFIKNIKQTILMMCAWYQSQDTEDMALLNNAIKRLAVGGKFMSSISKLNDAKTMASVVKFKRAKATGWERKSIELGQKTVTPTERATLGRTSIVRKQSTKAKTKEMAKREAIAIKSTDIRYKKQVKARGG